MNFDKQLRKIEAELERRLPDSTTPPAPLHAAMRYSVFAGGKRLRPLLCLAAASAFGSDSVAITPAAALEIMHTYTLIHDDLPAMDDDDLRRGKPTLHIVHGEAIAILAGDALLTMAFEWLAETTAPPPWPSGQLSLELARAAGSRGVIAGQAADMAAENQPPNPDMLLDIHRHKTGDLIRAAVRMGGIAGGASSEEAGVLNDYGTDIGLAFQIVDDLLNATGDSSKMGKSAGSDAQRGKMTWVSVYGVVQARRKVEELTAHALNSLKKLSGDTDPLAALTLMMTRRMK